MRFRRTDSQPEHAGHNVPNDEHVQNDANFQSDDENDDEYDPFDGEFEATEQIRADFDEHLETDSTAEFAGLDSTEEIETNAAADVEQRLTSNAQPRSESQSSLQEIQTNNVSDDDSEQETLGDFWLRPGSFATEYDEIEAAVENEPPVVESEPQEVKSEPQKGTHIPAVDQEPRNAQIPSRFKTSRDEYIRKRSEKLTRTGNRSAPKPEPAVRTPTPTLSTSEQPRDVDQAVVGNRSEELKTDAAPTPDLMPKTESTTPILATIDEVDLSFPMAADIRNPTQEVEDQVVPDHVTAAAAQSDVTSNRKASEPERTSTEDTIGPNPAEHEHIGPPSSNPSPVLIQSECTSEEAQDTVAYPTKEVAGSLPSEVHLQEETSSIRVAFPKPAGPQTHRNDIFDSTASNEVLQASPLASPRKDDIFTPPPQDVKPVIMNELESHKVLQRRPLSPSVSHEASTSTELRITETSTEITVELPEVLPAALLPELVTDDLAPHVERRDIDDMKLDEPESSTVPQAEPTPLTPISNRPWFAPEITMSSPSASINRSLENDRNDDVNMNRSFEENHDLGDASTQHNKETFMGEARLPFGDIDMGNFTLAIGPPIDEVNTTATEPVNATKPEAIGDEELPDAPVAQDYNQTQLPLGNPEIQHPTNHSEARSQPVQLNALPTSMLSQQPVTLQEPQQAPDSTSSSTNQPLPTMNQQGSGTYTFGAVNQHHLHQIDENYSDEDNDMHSPSVKEESVGGESVPEDQAVKDQAAADKAVNSQVNQPEAAYHPAVKDHQTEEEDEDISDASNDSDDSDGSDGDPPSPRAQKRPRSFLVQYRYNSELVRNPNHPGMKDQVPKLMLGAFYREVNMEAYYQAGEGSKRFKEEQDKILWYDPFAHDEDSDEEEPGAMDPVGPVSAENVRDPVRKPPSPGNSGMKNKVRSEEDSKRFRSEQDGARNAERVLGDVDTSDEDILDMIQMAHDMDDEEKITKNQADAARVRHQYEMYPSMNQDKGKKEEGKEGKRSLSPDDSAPPPTRNLTPDRPDRPKLVPKSRARQRNQPAPARRNAVSLIKDEDEDSDLSDMEDSKLKVLEAEVNLAQIIDKIKRSPSFGKDKPKQDQKPGDSDKYPYPADDFDSPVAHRPKLVPKSRAAKQNQTSSTPAASNVQQLALRFQSGTIQAPPTRPSNPVPSQLTGPGSIPLDTKPVAKPATTSSNHRTTQQQPPPQPQPRSSQFSPTIEAAFRQAPGHPQPQANADPRIPWDGGSSYTDRSGRTYEVTEADDETYECHFWTNEGQEIRFDEERRPVDGYSGVPYLG
ncbi:hypothetical protein N0V83_005796 [Neocucurbitaria cava]|uniref:Uncharacterized protein n=1 Tax=Neocucurbitaria cava TaxID=798079 RepID=A0A9W9CML0_9PLEO|nr:hypothetical protein N0V83_005796 [Neocucurbitaria cava]